MSQRITIRTVHWLLAAGIAAAAGGAWARNDKLLLPIAPALRSGPQLPPDIPFAFGRASAAGVDVSTGSATVHAVADPFSSPNANSGGQRVRRPDAVVCADAFRKAMSGLLERARSAGATSLVGIVSNYEGVEMDSPTTYECHIGHTRGVVDLRGHFGRGPAPVAVAPANRVPPAPPNVTAAPGQPPRIASGFAAIDDIDAIPYLSDRGRQHYREWLALPTPKAFAISSTGYFYATSGLRPKDTTLPTDPNERALQGCERNAKVACKLYAVNGSVVWTKD